MQLRFLPVLLPFIASCGDNKTPVSEIDAHVEPPDAPRETWGDAERVWSTAWCGYAQRCYPDMFMYYFGSLEQCTVLLQAQNCAYAQRLHDCSEEYPDDLLGALLQCQTDMETIECTATEAPASCYEAFGQ